MDKNGKKKVLAVMGMEHKLEHFMKAEPNVNPENLIILQSYQPIISHPFDDLMRDIILTVFQENVEEIIVVPTNDPKRNNEAILNKINENKELQNKIQTLDYLFKNSIPEITGTTVSEWLQGADIQKTIHIIRNHPLLPSYIKVRETRKTGGRF